MPHRIVVIPDTQCKPGAPTDHLIWIGQEIAKLQPQEIIHVGDNWDNPSCSSYDKPGSAAMEGKRWLNDKQAGDEGLAIIDAPINAEISRQKKNKHKEIWAPEKVLLLGNHCIRPDRIAENDPRLLGLIGSHLYDTRNWRVVPFLKVHWSRGVAFCHYFPGPHSGKPIGGTVNNMLNRIGSSFVQGHRQGLDNGSKPLGTGRTMRGIVAGSAYLHEEEYRGPEGQAHWRGILQLAEVENGQFDVMELSLKHLCRKYESMDLHRYMKLKYRGDWSFLA